MYLKLGYVNLSVWLCFTLEVYHLCYKYAGGVTMIDDQLIKQEKSLNVIRQQQLLREQKLRLPNNVKITIKFIVRGNIYVFIYKTYLMKL